MSILTNAILARPTLSAWSARKLDKRVTAETNRAHGAAHDAGRYNKRLLADSALAEINRLDGEIRRRHSTLSRPWLTDGTGILPVALFDEYRAAMESFAESRRAAVDSFVGNYDSLKESARRSLNGMFNDSDYPDAAVIRGKFRFDVAFLPVPSGSDFRASLPVGQAARIAADVESRVKQAQSDAMRETCQQALDAVSHMAAKLSAFKPAAKAGDKTEGIFRDSLVENVREIARLLPAFNLSGDHAFADMAARISRELTEHDAGALRDSDNLRQAVADKAAQIAADMAAFM